LILAVVAVFGIGSYAYADWGMGYGRHMGFGWGSGYGNIPKTEMPAFKEFK
jgi:hypothetical protein